MNDHQKRLWLIIKRSFAIGRTALAMEYIAVFQNCDEGQCHCREGIGAHMGHVQAAKSVADAGFRV